MNKHLSNWHFNQEFSHPMDPWKPQKRKPSYYLLGLILAASGSWLVLFTLGLQGLHPFRPQISPSLEDKLVSGFTPSVSLWSGEIQKWSERWNLDPLLVAAVMQIESCGNPNVVSTAGAQGLFQVMPYHFEPNENTLDPEINAQRGLAYLQGSYTLAEGDIELTLAGYNGGHGQINKDKSNWPDETQRYASWGAGIYFEAVSGQNPPKTLSEWLKAGGWRLCQEAEKVLGIQ
jgi:soluble lytic murein transglycosylase-like protein